MGVVDVLKLVQATQHVSTEMSMLRMRRGHLEYCAADVKLCSRPGIWLRRCLQLCITVQHAVDDLWSGGAFRVGILAGWCTSAGPQAKHPLWAIVTTLHKVAGAWSPCSGY